MSSASCRANKGFRFISLMKQEQDVIQRACKSAHGNSDKKVRRKTLPWASPPEEGKDKERDGRELTQPTSGLAPGVVLASPLGRPRQTSQQWSDHSSRRISNLPTSITRGRESDARSTITRSTLTSSTTTASSPTAGCVNRPQSLSALFVQRIK